MELHHQTIFIVGGAGGLGKELAKILAAQGASITLFGRTQRTLDIARDEVLAVRLDETQNITSVAADMSIGSEVESAFRSQPRVPDQLYCVAGGTQHECGFLEDIDASELQRCMNSNYFTAAYPAQSLLKIWTGTHGKSNGKPKRPALRRIIFINSACGLIPLPGYTAYTTSKYAVRALADTLRMEVLRHSNREFTYTVHCAFLNTFITDAFLEEQAKKPELTKRIEGTLGSRSDLINKFPSAPKVALHVVTAVGRGDFAICDNSLDTNLVWANNIGTSPRRGLGIVDAFLALLTTLIIWPVLRLYYDRMCRKDGDQLRLGQSGADNIGKDVERTREPAQ